MDVAEARDAVVGMEPLAVLLHPRPRAGLDLPWDELLIQDPAAPALELPKGSKGTFTFP